MIKEIRSNIRVRVEREPELVAFLESVSPNDRAYNMVRLMSLGLIVERGGFTSLQPTSKQTDEIYQSAANDVSNTVEVNNELELEKAGIGDLFESVQNSVSGLI